MFWFHQYFYGHLWLVQCILAIARVPAWNSIPPADSRWRSGVSIMSAQREQSWSSVPHRRRRQRNCTSPHATEGAPVHGSEMPSPPSVLILVGLPGSGKSTLAEGLCQAQPHQYVRVNQDTLGNRQKCLRLAQRTLQQGQCPIIDRCNASVEQRRHWTRLAAEHQKLLGTDAVVPVDCVVLDVPVDVCLRRCETRDNHPTLTSQNARGVIRAMAKEWEMPLADIEGLRSVTIVRHDDDKKAADQLQEIVDQFLQL